MPQISVGDDGSPAAAQAVAWATRFAAECEALVTVVHVTTTGDASRVDDDGVDHVTIRDDHPASAIMSAAADLDADVIVLGRRGRGGFPSLPIGTTVHSVAGACGRTVVVVPPADLTPDGPLLRRVLVGLDGDAGSARAASWAVRHGDGARFTAVHALQHLPALVEDGDGDTARLSERATASVRDSWSRPFRDAGIEFDVVVDSGDAADVILATAEDVRADLVVVGRQDRGTTCGILGGISQRVLAYAHCAAAIVQL